MRATIACLTLLTSSAFVVGPQQRTFSPWGKVWTGEIRIVRQGRADQKKDKSDDKKKHFQTRKRTVTEELSVKVCGLYDDLQVLEARRTLTDQEDWGEDIRYDETTCDYPEEARGHNPIYIIKNFKKETKKPGNSTSVIGSGITEIYVGNDAPALKQGVSVKLEFPDSGSFQIDISSLALASYRSDQVARYFSVCSGKTGVTEIHMRAVGPSAQERASFNESGEGDAKRAVSETWSHPTAKPLAATFRDPIRDGSLSGSRQIGKIPALEPGGYEETTTATWNFTSKDPCPEVMRKLLVELAFAEAYSERALQDFAGSISEYESLVSDRAYRILTGKPAPKKEGSPSEVEMGVDPQTCKIKNQDQFKEKTIRRCQPLIFFDAAWAHENIHVQQCQKFHEEMNSGDPHIKGPMEVTAYMESAQMLLDWLKDGCPGIDTTAEEKRLDKLRQAKFRRHFD